ncbi:MAG: potassium-transporting ATPase subunit F [Candidatus Riflebacteria bacterium]|nr:potassium-transporting ATPase subunit F [Candidatus Riflebacteria bacterium]
MVLLSGLVVIFCSVYLVYVIINPEKF